MVGLRAIANNRQSGRGKKHTTYMSFKKGSHNDTVSQPGYFEALMKFVTSDVEGGRGAMGKAGGRGARFA